MRLRSLILLGICVALTACGGGSGWTPPEYSGHQESTEGVPGFDKGQKKSPYVKLGQSYKVMGEWYVPRFQPNYDETGMASWYGPGFHGGKTANGEQFDKHSMTAAHKTLPLPSLVRVTMVDTGKSAIVRINDRGPFSKGRIIDLSYAAANEIGLIKKGVAKVRVEYLLPESQRFADLLAQGREPEEIDIASEVLPYANNREMVAEAEIREKANRPVTDRSWWNDVSPVSSAQASEARRPLYGDASPDAAPTQQVASADLPPPTSTTRVVPATDPSVFNVLNDPKPPAELPAPTASVTPTQVASVTQPAAQETPAVPEPLNAMYVQVGTFSLQENAMAMTKKVMDIGPAKMNVVNHDNVVLYRVRLGPYDNPEMAEEVLDRVHQMGMVDARFVRP